MDRRDANERKMKLDQGAKHLIDSPSYQTIPKKIMYAQSTRVIVNERFYYVLWFNIQIRSYQYSQRQANSGNEILLPHSKVMVKSLFNFLLMVRTTSPFEE
jgi:hypothetical protein